MRQVEKHIIKKSHPLYKEIDRICWLSKNLFNATNYRVRQKFIKEGKYLNYANVYHLIKDSTDYKAIPAKVSCQIIKLVGRCWSSFFAATKEYKKDPSKFTGRPKIPKYKHKTEGRCVTIYPNQAVSKRGLKQGLVQLSGTNISISTAVNTPVNEVRLVPRCGLYVVEVIYEVEEKTIIEGNQIASIDIGLHNLATVTSNKKGFSPLIINGKPLKAINQFFNKQKAHEQEQLQLQYPDRYVSNRINKLTAKRNCKIDTYLHQASRTVINYLLQNQIGTLVIGKNTSWKQEINLGKRNNQNFVQIPHAKFIEQLVYKAKLVGIKTILVEESYTSKASFLDLDYIPTYDKTTPQNYKFSGKRIYRGLYKSKDGVLLSSDVNGSYNILRKAVPNAFVEGIEGLGVIPFRFTPGKVRL